jgi:hypothetical protein
MIVALPAAHSDGVYQMPALAHHGGPALLTSPLCRQLQIYQFGISGYEL